MAYFFWRRRNRYYNPRRRWRRKYRPRRTRKRFRRRSYRRPTRRRRKRRKTKVRKKKPFLKLLQWQPDSIRKCKIKTVDILLLGANGKQFRNYVTCMNEWVPSRTPGGGGFTTAVFSLAFLYEQYQLKKNIWTASNINYDLCRYTGCKFIFYRHPYLDFVIEYQRQYPMSLNLNDYFETHPYRMLLKKNIIIVPSLKYKPHGKPYVKKKILPPKQMVNKWFFQDMFSDKPLVLLKASVCDLKTPFLGISGENELVTLTCINIHDLYTMGNWGDPNYKPYSTYSQSNIPYNPQTGTQQTLTFTSATNYTGGFFDTKLLKAKNIKFAQTFYPATYTVRYNPKEDTGVGNTVYLASIHSSDFHVPSSDKVLVVKDQPLWLSLFGFTDYVKQLKKPAETYQVYYLIIQTKHMPAHPSGTLVTTHVVIDSSFIQGLGPYSVPVLPRYSNKWYPTLEHQQQSINNIVKSGPFIPKPDPTKANWELHYKSTFFFKWGGAQDNTKPVSNPAEKTDYITPDTVFSGLQVADPKKQIPETVLHTWDFRRDLITKRAFKRMSEYLPPETIVSTDSEYHSPHKKAKQTLQTPLLQEEENTQIHCLQQLYAESTCPNFQEETETSLQQLIKQQHQEQQQIKLNLLQLLNKLKRAQLQMQLQSGLLE
nr:MAG: ORF1 [Torque teno midi virus]UHK04076.1 MAG: ORF1 [Torque teno midi virus]UHK04078.1 MAG: ORF1 [Torque teno midi virus]